MATEICYKLRTKDDRDFTLSKKAAEASELITRVAEDCGLMSDDAIKSMDPIPLPSVDAETFNLLQKWLEEHKDCPKWDEEKWWENERSEELTKWEDNFMKELTSETLDKIFRAANYMCIKCLLDKCANAVAEIIKGKSVDEIRQVWMIQSDFSPEETAAIRTENPWEAILKFQEELEKNRAQEVDENNA